MQNLTAKPALIVEDELFVLLEIEDVVGSLATGFQSCSSVESALAWLETNQPGFAVVDYRLRDATSEALVSRLREMNVPTVIYSGNEYSTDFDDPILGTFKWLAKPLAPDELKTEILKLVASSE